MPFNPERINIHELTIEEPEKQADLPFDVEKDITEEDWEKMKLGLDDFRHFDNWDAFFSQAAHMKILNPNLDLDLDGPLQAINDELKKCEPVRYVSDAKILGAKPNIVISSELQSSWTHSLERLVSNNDWFHAVEFASAVRIVDPHFDLGLSGRNYQDMLRDLENTRGKRDWILYSWRASELKLLNPKIDLGITREFWKEMRECLNRLREIEDYNSFAKQAWAMKILAAEKVEITEKGVEITMPRPKQSMSAETPPLPEAKKF